MAQNYGFGRAFRPGSKENDSLFVAAVPVRHPLDFIAQKGVDFAPQADFFSHLFQKDDFVSVSFQHIDNRFHFGGFDERKGRNDFFDLCCFAH